MNGPFNIQVYNRSLAALKLLDNPYQQDHRASILDLKR